MDEVIEDAPNDVWIATTLATPTIYVSIRMTRLQDWVIVLTIRKRYEYMVPIHQQSKINTGFYQLWIIYRLLHFKISSLLNREVTL